MPLPLSIDTVENGIFGGQFVGHKFGIYQLNIIGGSNIYFGGYIIKTKLSKLVSRTPYVEAEKRFESCRGCV